MKTLTNFYNKGKNQNEIRARYSSTQPSGSQPVCRGTLVCCEKSPGVPRKILEKNYLEMSNFAVLVHELWRERKTVSSGADLFFITMVWDEN